MSNTDKTIKAIGNHVLIIDMNFEAEKTKSGIIVPSQNGKSSGVKPRWGKVYAVGPDQKDVKEGDWIYVEHGRWTRGIDVKDVEGNDLVVRRVDTDCILVVADEKPDDIYIAE